MIQSLEILSGDESLQEKRNTKEQEMNIERRRACRFIAVTLGLGHLAQATAAGLSLGSVTSLLGGGSSGGADRANQLLAVAAKAEMQMYENFSLALGRKEQADAFRQMADSISEDTIEKEWKKKNEMIDENPMSEDELATVEAEQAVYLQTGYGFGSVALLNYGLLTAMLVDAIKELKSNPLGNLGKIQMMSSAAQAIPKGISTITSMLSTSRKVAKKHNIEMPSKQDIAKLSEEAGGEADVSELPD